MHAVESAYNIHEDDREYFYSLSIPRYILSESSAITSSLDLLGFPPKCCRVGQYLMVFKLYLIKIGIPHLPAHLTGWKWGKKIPLPQIRYFIVSATISESFIPFCPLVLMLSKNMS